MRHAAQNKECPVDAGTPECSDMTWPYDEFGDDTPCQHCDWWDVTCSPDDEPTVTVVDTSESFNTLLASILKSFNIEEDDSEAV